MNHELYNNAKVAAYFLWEYTGDDNALNLWYCAEDIACSFERHEILSVDDVAAIIKKGHDDFEYIQFMRQVAYRIFAYTAAGDSAKNWFAAERLICNREWVRAIVDMARFYSQNKGSVENMGLRNPAVRGLYL